MLTVRWKNALLFDPVAPLILSDNRAVSFYAARDLLGTTNEKLEAVWDLPDAKKITRKQRDDGSWEYPGGNTNIRSAENYNQIETFRQLGYLIEMFGYDMTSPVVAKAAEYLFGFQTGEGDIRGILGNQYSPYYTAAIVELLIKAGYANDPRVGKAFTWLNNIRQNDGGWAIPFRTRGEKLDAISMGMPTIEPDKVKPFSHMVTGVVLRAYAVHPVHKHSSEARAAGALLRDSLFKSDCYPDRKGKEYWVKFTFPFWFTDLISAMDSLSRLGFTIDEPQIKKACQWFIDHQDPDGTWKLQALKNLRYDNDLWMSLSICRIFKRLYG